jgi:predicted GNAT family N-acyltransferase
MVMHMSNLEEYHFIEISWSTAASDIIELRKKVFVIEQRFDESHLFDENDLDSYHILATNSSGTCIGCGRITLKGKIDYIAVLINERGHGVGSMILKKLIQVAERYQIADLSLCTETALVHFYDQQEFKVDGPVYMKKGVPFQKMIKHIN